MITYLYVKTHTITGLKYLGKTSRIDPHKYKGSGTYWLRHLKKHGATYTTEIIQECIDPAEVSTWGRYYSNLWNVVESEEWANLRPESGDGGDMSMCAAWRDGIKNRKHGRAKGTFSHSDATKQLIKEKRSLQVNVVGTSWSAETRAKQAARVLPPISETTREKLRNRKGGMTGKSHSEEAKEKMRATKSLNKIKKSSST